MADKIMATTEQSIFIAPIADEYGTEDAASSRLDFLRDHDHGEAFMVPLHDGWAVVWDAVVEERVWQQRMEER